MCSRSLRYKSVLAGRKRYIGIVVRKRYICIVVRKRHKYPRTWYYTYGRSFKILTPLLSSDNPSNFEPYNIIRLYTSVLRTRTYLYQYLVKKRNEMTSHLMP